MEVLAGKPDFQVTTSENGCLFTFDFSKVYWNSRLQTEHTRLVDSFDTQDVIADGFAGVGPFAVPAAAKRGCLGVLANDLNPMSASSLRENVKLNKVCLNTVCSIETRSTDLVVLHHQVEDIVRCYNTDGRHFFRQAVQELYEKPFPGRSGPRMSASKAAKLARHERGKKRNQASDMQADASQSSVKASSKEVQQQSPPGRFVEHCIMNLPASAIDMLDAFDSLYTPFMSGSEEKRTSFLKDLEEYSRRKSKGEWNGELRLPMVHCYCFTKEVDDYEPDICKVGLRSQRT